MDVGKVLSGIQGIDFVVVLFFLFFFVLGFAQGTLRRLLGIASILFSFLLAANLAAPVSDFLGANWTQFPREYSYMVGFGTIFIASAIAFALVVQGFYTPQALFARARFADEILGALLGLVEAAILFAILLIILDSFFRIPGIPADPQELPFLRELWTVLDTSKMAEIWRETFIPGFFVLVGLFIPDNIEANYPAGG